MITRRNVKTPIASAHRLLQPWPVAYIPFDPLEFRPVQAPSVAPGAQQCPDLMAAPHQFVDEVGADKARRTCDKAFHCAKVLKISSGHIIFPPIVSSNGRRRRPRRLASRRDQFYESLISCFSGPTILSDQYSVLRDSSQLSCTLIAPRTLHTLDLHLRLRNNAWCRMPEKRSAKTKKLTRKDVRELDVKITFLEGIVHRDPRYVEALQILGDHYTQRGKFDSSLKVDEQLSRLEPQNPLVFYNLACSYSLNSELDLAAAALEKALLLGYRDFKWLAKDPDLRRLRKHPVYQTIEAKIRKMKIRIV
jgi:hypothetical protein